MCVDFDLRIVVVNAKEPIALINSIEESGVGSNPSKKRKDDSVSPEMNNTESNEVDGSGGRLFA